MSHFKAPSSLTPPTAKKISHTETFHGITTEDDYHWLRADNWQEAMREPDTLPDDIKQYLNAENDYCASAMSDTKDLQKQLVKEMRGRIQEDDASVPQKSDDYLYNTRYESGMEHPLFVRTALDGSNEETLLDGNKEAENTDYFVLGDLSISPKHSRLAWTCDNNGSEFFNLSIRNLTDKKDIDYQISDVGSIAWANDDVFFYTKIDESHRPNRIFKHCVGDDPQNDTLIMQEDDARFFMSVDRTLSGDYILLTTGMNDQDECWFIPTSSYEDKPKLIAARQDGIEYAVEHHGNQFLIVTNADQSEDFKIVSTPCDKPEPENWADFIPHKSGRMILSLEIYKDWIIWMERENALPSIVIQNLTGEQQRISFDEEAFSLGLSASLEYQSNSIRFTYSSPTTPTQVYDYDLLTGDRELRKSTVIPSGHNPNDYITKRLFAPSHDGELVPITVVYHHTTKLDGSAPCLLYAYGSYGHAMPAYFSSNRLSLVDRGFVYAIAHVRGGEEKGRAWYLNAKFEKKPNTFHDFIAAGEYLAKQAYTSRGNIVCHGASAGGLLIGAVVNMSPYLFAGGIADVPFVDMLNTILDETLPLTPGEWSQWGNPIESVDAYQWIASYSPYDNVSEQDYPCLLITAGVSDPRVTYWEPAKWAAKLRTRKTDDNILMLKTNMTSGHFGKSGRFAELEDAAHAFAFALKCVGKAEEAVLPI